MTRWKPKHTKTQVIEFYRENKDMKSTEMAEHLHCSPEYVRATLARAGITLARSKRKQPSLCGINQIVDRPRKKIKKRLTT